MQILLMIARKMLNNRWLVGSLLLGLMITVALVSSIPSYTSGILQRLLTKELEEQQIESNVYSGSLYQYVILRDGNDPTNKTRAFHNMERFFGNLDQRVGLPVKAQVSILETNPLAVQYDDTERYDANIRQPYGRITALSNLEEYIEITDGRMPSEEPVDGIYEVLVPEVSLSKRNMVLGTVFNVSPSSGPSAMESMLVKPVGTFAPKDASDLYWYFPVNTYEDNFIFPDSLFRAEFIDGEKQSWVHNAKFFKAYDYHEISISDIPTLLTIDNRIRSYVNQQGIARNDLRIDYPMKETIRGYLEQERQLVTMLWSLSVPVLIMLAIYLFMVSRLIVDRQLTEIAVLRSRGAGRIQIILIYLFEVVVLGAIAYAIGPHIGLQLSKMLGASSGFLEFVQRTALPVELTADAYKYALWAIIGCILMVMFPVIMGTRQTIVSHKQQMARSMGSALWHKFFIDIALLLVAWYGWTTFQRRHEEMLRTQASASDLSFDPLLFFVPALFVIGFGLFCLRVYPWLIRLVYWLGRKVWPLSMYQTMVQVGRSSKQYQFLMLFLIMTIAIGIFSASAARTINKNLEEQIQYRIGADVVLETRWQSDAPRSNQGQGGQPPGMGGGNEQSSDTTFAPTRIQYVEPPFEPFTRLAGVEHAAKVQQKSNVIADAQGNSVTSAHLMAIEPKGFGETAWFNHSLKRPYHLNHYLNLLASEQSAVLISTSLANRLGANVGDYLELAYERSHTARFVVYGIIDYWPSWNPIGQGGNHVPYLAVANLPYIQDTLGLDPYEIWMKLEEDALSADLYEDIKEQNISFTRLEDTSQDIIRLKNGAFLLGLNGALTLSFIISMTITFIGFLIYWILTLGSRVLQYGIFRALGVSLGQLMRMLTWEQLLTSGMACILGIIIGGVTSRVFVPMFQLTFDSSAQVPPFQVIFDPTDEMRIYAFVGIMLIIGLSILGWLLTRIRIHQAVKLGED